MNQINTTQNNTSLINNLKQSQVQQSIPSSFSFNPQYFNQRLIRIKSKIDDLIKQCISSNQQQTQLIIKQVKTEINNEDKSGSQTSRSIASTYGRQRQIITLPAEKIIGETKLKIKNIYNQIHSLEVISVKDQNSIETNTFELRSFLKDLRNQSKRLIRILPDSVHFEIQNQKKQPYKKSQIILGNQKIGIINIEQVPQSQIKTPKHKDKDIGLAKQLIEATLNKRRIFKQTERYYEDKQDKKCNLFQCQII